MNAKPFLKWVGSKRQLIPQLLAHVPERFNAYHEPFLGGGALFFELRSTMSEACPRAYLSDANVRLIRTYRGVRDTVEDVIEPLSTYPYERKFFEYTRRIPIDNVLTYDDSEVAAWFIYLNKTCFNGLYRVNKSGAFNVPFGRYTNPKICDAENIRACSRALKCMYLTPETFECVLDRGEPGDFVYFDPPYVPLTKTSSFTSYTANKFDMAEQVALRDVALALKRRGVYVLLSNSSSPAVFELYKDFKIETVQARRSVNSKAEGRSSIAEVLIW